MQLVLQLGCEYVAIFMEVGLEDVVSSIELIFEYVALFMEVGLEDVALCS